ncbi:MAG: translation initiation factor IF-3 [Candidatus Latescibacteria bacterium]|nr:translation initiation factor IF-3 [Candidatus Latescibacterota bacterium]
MRVNEQVKSTTVRLIKEDGEQVGVISIEEALRIADDAGNDLVEVSPNADPPVCRIMNYGKYRYELTKKAKDARKKRHIIHIKEIKMRPEISIHDFDFKVRHAAEFLEHKDKVKFTLIFRGREILHKDHGKVVLLKVIEKLKDLSVIETDIHSEGRNLSMLLAPK